MAYTTPALKSNGRYLKMIGTQKKRKTDGVLSKPNNSLWFSGIVTTVLLTNMVLSYNTELFETNVQT